MEIEQKTAAMVVRGRLVFRYRTAYMGGWLSKKMMLRKTQFILGEHWKAHLAPARSMDLLQVRSVDDGLVWQTPKFPKYRHKHKQGYGKWRCGYAWFRFEQSRLRNWFECQYPE